MCSGALLPPTAMIEPKPRPKIILSPLDEPADYDALARTHLLAMEGNELYDRLYPKERRPEWERRVADYIARRTARPPLPSWKHELKASYASDPSHTLVGVMVWEDVAAEATTPSPTDSDETKVDEAGAEPSPESEQEKSEEMKENEKQIDFDFLRWMGSLVGRTRKEVMQGRRHFYLSVCLVHPSHQSRGIGSAIIDYGLALADAADPHVACHLESSPEARPIYERKGFRVVRELEVASAEGGGRTFELPVMVRQPAGWREEVGMEGAEKMRGVLVAI